MERTRTHKNHRRTHQNRRTRKNNTGGKALASGGFGCVFYPALKCKNRNKKHTNSISKVMLAKFAKKEYQKIKSIQSKLKHLANYKRYFVVYGVDVCRPAPLKETDLTFFEKKCTPLLNQNITKKNVNQKLGQLMMLNVPYAGTTIDSYIYNHGLHAFYKIHTKLVDLLKHGIMPMNQLGIYHSDIKSSNILVDKSLQPRLIDWGLSVEYVTDATNTHKHPFPHNWRNRPLQYNVPFSIILFTDSFYGTYSHYLASHRNTPNITTLTPFVTNYMQDWMKERGEGHYKFITNIVHILYTEESSDPQQSIPPSVVEEKTFDIIRDYILQTLLHHTHVTEEGVLNLRIYVNDVFVHLLDIWGFINVYYPVLEVLHTNRANLTIDQWALFTHLKQLFLTYLYQPITHDKINMNYVYKDLNHLGELLYNLH